MTANELYACPPIRQRTDLCSLSAFVPFDLSGIDDEANTQVVIKCYADHDFDGRRIWYLFSVWYKNRPIMVCQQAGREGNDHTEEFITDPDGYTEMINYISSVVRPPDLFPEGRSHDPDVDIENLTRFYGTSLDKFYDPEGVDPKHKVGDEVVVLVPKNHLAYETEQVKTWVRITAVFPYSPGQTYSGLQLNRRWATDEIVKGYYMMTAAGEGDMGAHFSESEICENDDLPRGE